METAINKSADLAHHDLLSRTIFVTVVNSSTDSHSLSLFNSYQDMTDSEISKDISISVHDATHVRFKKEISERPVHIEGLKFIVNTQHQLGQQWTLRTIDPIGLENISKYSPLSKYNSLAYIDDENFKITLNGYNSIEFEIGASESVILILYLKEERGGTLKSFLKNLFSINGRASN